MPLVCNIRALEKGAVRLVDELPAAELDVDGFDECVRLSLPIKYDLEVQSAEKGLLVRGRVEVTLDCDCVRCLRPFQQELVWPDWTCFVPLVGEDSVKVVNDQVDLTPFLREDILLDYPQHPLCEPGCDRLPRVGSGLGQPPGGVKRGESGSPVWIELNKLKWK